MTATIRTVDGDIEAPPEGIVLPHEHLLIDHGIPRGEPRALVDGSLLDRVSRGVVRARDAGVVVLVDCTPPGYGRYLDVLRDVARRAGVAIVAATGSFTEEWAPLPWWVRGTDVAALAEWFARELSEGAGDTTIPAGVIKCATGSAWSDEEERVLRAAGRAQAATGRPIVGHTTAGLGLEQLDVYEEEGADAARVVISHVGFEDDPVPYAVAIAERQAYVGLDRIGHHHFFADDHWVRLVLELLERGHGDRVLLSHDAVTRFSGPEDIAAKTFSDYTYLATRFLPRLREAGVDDATLDALTRRNPGRWLTGAGA